MALSLQRKADALTVVAIAFALPAYYKVRYLLEGQLGLADFLAPSVFFEILFALLLATLLVFLYRWGQEHLKSVRSRWAIKLAPAGLVIGSALVALLFTRFFFGFVVPWGSSPSFEFDIVVLALILPLLVSGVADRIFLQGEANAAKEATLSAEYEALKARLSPHFLFNSLNTLADLVEEDPELAIGFIEEMAAIYRYVLEHRDEPLVPLASEIAAIQSLIRLLETRRPGSIAVDVNIAASANGKKIVPLAVQTVVENALKHNRYAADAPLQLRIYADADELVVENRVNRRTSVPSTASGLQNLRQRVQHVCRRPIEVNDDGKMFSVRVPLMGA